MITLAVASAFLTLASQLSDFTGGEDGLSFRVPELLSPGFMLREAPLATPLGRGRSERPPDHLLPDLRGGHRDLPHHPAHREFAVRPRAAGDPRKRLSRRGAGLPHGGLPHAVQRALGLVRHAGGLPARDLAALPGARHLAVVRDHAGHPAHRRDWRHGHALRRAHRQRDLCAGAELPARPAARGRHRHRRHSAAARAAHARPLAALAGRAVRAVGLLLSHRRGGQVAGARGARRASRG